MSAGERESLQKRVDQDWQRLIDKCQAPKAAV
jgi:hypothetical protein